MNTYKCIGRCGTTWHTAATYRTADELHCSRCGGRLVNLDKKHKVCVPPPRRPLSYLQEE